MQVSANQIAKLLGGQVIGDPDVTVNGPSKIEEGTPGSITFLGNPKYESFIYETKASVVLVSKDFVPDKPVSATLVIVENVYEALAILMDKFNSGLSINRGVSPTAIVDSSAELGENCSIDDLVIIKHGAKIGSNTKVYGQVFIGDNVKIGQNSVLYPGVKIYHNCIIGDDCVLHANVVIGSDGFGFAKDDHGNYKKIAQTGNVVIENGVEIGSNTVIDRATMGSTIIKSGVKLDNLIQIAHNVTIGKNTAIAAQTGVAGSVKIGENCLIGGQVGFAGHIEISDGTMIQAQSGISSSTKDKNTKLYGTPAIEYQNYLKSYAYFKKFPDIVAQIKALEKEIKELTEQLVEKK